MKNLFAGSLLFALIFGFSASGEGFQKKRHARKRSATLTRPPIELTTPPLRSSIDEIRQEIEKAVEVIEPANKAEAELSSFIVTFDSFTKQLAGKIIAADKPLEGATQAQEFLDAQKAEMKARFAAVSCTSSSKVSRKFKEEMSTHFFNNGVLIGRLISIYGSDYSVKLQLLRLTKDFVGLLEIKPPCPTETLAAR
ncbi:MAG: hypothetical protein QOF02_1505 [Blastocatellia bacterium]|jgi:hypothetical protein|nr:hypothetical protein [Blastocatellia bacterium]